MRDNFLRALEEIAEPLSHFVSSLREEQDKVIDYITDFSKVLNTTRPEKETLDITTGQLETLSSVVQDSDKAQRQAYQTITMSERVGELLKLDEAQRRKSFKALLETFKHYDTMARQHQ